MRRFCEPLNTYCRVEWLCIVRRVALLAAESTRPRQITRGHAWLGLLASRTTGDGPGEAP